MPDDYFLLRDDAGRWVFSGGPSDENLGVGYRSHGEALDSLTSYLNARGLQVSRAIPTDQGFRVETHLSGQSAIAAIDPEAVRFSVGSLQDADRYGSMLASSLKTRAARRAAADGRQVVKPEDVWAVVGEVVQEMADQMNPSAKSAAPQ